MKALASIGAAAICCCALLAVLAIRSTVSAQETKPYQDGEWKGTQTEKKAELANGHTTVTKTITATASSKSGTYDTRDETTVIEKDANGNIVRESTLTIEKTFIKKDGDLALQEVYDFKKIYNSAGGYTETYDSTRTDKLTGEKTKSHRVEEFDENNEQTSGHLTTTTSRPGEQPVVKEQRYNKDKQDYEDISRGIHGGPTASMYLTGTIRSLQGCEGEFYNSFPKVGTTSTDYGRVTTKGGVFTFNGSAMEYDPYTGKLMADGSFTLNSTRSGGTSITGTIHADDTISGTWQKSYDPQCSYTVTLTRGKRTAGSNISVTGGGSWRSALSGLHQ